MPPKRAPLKKSPAALIDAAPVDLSVRVAAIEAELNKSSSAERRLVAVNYFPTAMRVLGVPVPAIRFLARALAKELKTAPPEEVLALAEALVASGSMEGRQVAYELLALHKPTAAALTVADVERLRQGLDNWASVDSFAASVAGAAWRRGQLPDSLFDKWANSSDRFVRRLALVCTVPLNTRAQGGKGDISRTLRLCERLLTDRDEFVVKALSWALRELIPHDVEAVKSFLLRHDDKLSRRVVREVNHKLTSGRKNGPAAANSARQSSTCR